MYKIKLVLIIVFSVWSVNALAQNGLIISKDNQKENLDLSTIGYAKDTIAFNRLIKDYKDEFYYYFLEEDYTPRINDLYEDLHLIDLNGDGELDIIFEGEVGGEAISIKIFLYENSNYIKILDDGQAIKQMEFKSGVLSKIHVEDWDCCGGVTEYQCLYNVDFNKSGEEIFTLDYMLVYYAGLEWPEVYFKSRKAFRTLNKNYNLRFEPQIDDATVVDMPALGVGNSIGTISLGTKGYAFAEKADITGRIWWFVALPSEETETVYKDDLEEYRLGWISSRYVETIGENN